MIFGFDQKPDFILKFRSMYQRVGNCYVGDIRKVIEMLYCLKFSIFLQRSKDKLLLFKTMPIKSLPYLIKGIKKRNEKTRSKYLLVNLKRERERERKREEKRNIYEICFTTSSVQILEICIQCVVVDMHIDQPLQKRRQFKVSCKNIFVPKD